MLAGPSRWSVRRLRDVADLRVSNVDKHEKDGEVPVRLCNYVDVYKNDRITEQIPFMRATAAEDEVERFRLRHGDVLITKDSETWTDIGVPALVEYEAPDLVSGYHLALLRPRRARMEGAFLLRALQTADVAHQFHVRATGVTRFGLSHAEIKSVLVPVPPLAEQLAIVRFLDHADRRIQRAIRAKQKLIALLIEQKQAVIHRAVTRGLDPNVRLKPSGVGWLGDVPERWGVMPLKWAFRSMTYGISESGTGDGSIRLLAMGNVRDGRVVVPDAGGVHQVDPHLLLEENDLLFNRTNSLLHVGKVGLFVGADAPVTFASYLVRMRPKPEHNPEYLNLLLNDVSIRSIARREAIPSLHQANLNPTRFGRLHIALPGRVEQSAIVGFVRAATSDLDRAIAGAERNRHLLAEYRARLIADLVTGNVDVREAAARLPDDDAEPESLDEIDVAEDEDGDVEGLEAVEA
jgi:type I restriction enzyme, S subunit